MTIIKRNQIIILSLAIMIIAAGYLNYTYMGSDPFSQELTGTMGDRLGEATLVDQGEGDIGYAEPVSSNLTNKTPNPSSDSSQPTGQNSQSIQTGSTDKFFSDTRMEKERVRDQEISLHERVLGNSSASKEAHEKAQAELAAISSKWEKEMIIERLIKAKGFKDAVVFINQNSVNVVVLNDGKLTTAQTAQIQDIVLREAKVPLEGVKIVVK